MQFLRPLSASLAAVCAALALCAPAWAGARWLLVSDIHFDPAARYATLAPTGRDSDRALLESTVAAMRRADPDAPVVIVAGDLLAHHFSGDALGAMREIAGDFDRAFPHAQFVYVLGNNDDPCGDYRIGVDSGYLHALAAIWAPLVNRRGAAPRFERDFGRYGYYTARLPGTNRRAIALNSVAWSWLYKPCTPRTVAPGDRELQWLAATLAASQMHDLLVMHVPPGVDATSTRLVAGLYPVPYWNAPAQASFVDIVGRNRPSIQGILAGHEHRDDVRYVAGLPLDVVGSVSPIYGNVPAFYELDVASNGTQRVEISYRLAGTTWVESAATYRPMDRITECAQAVGSDFGDCIAMPERRGVAVAVVLLISGATWLLLRMRRRKSR